MGEMKYFQVLYQMISGERFCRREVFEIGLSDEECKKIIADQVINFEYFLINNEENETLYFVTKNIEKFEVKGPFTQSEYEEIEKELIEELTRKKAEREAEKRKQEELQEKFDKNASDWQKFIHTKR